MMSDVQTHLYHIYLTITNRVRIMRAMLIATRVIVHRSESVSLAPVVYLW